VVLVLSCLGCPQLLDDSFRAQGALQNGGDAASLATDPLEIDPREIEPPEIDPSPTVGGRTDSGAAVPLPATPARDAAATGSGGDEAGAAPRSTDAGTAPDPPPASPARRCRSGSHATASGACYALFQTRLNWPAARDDCRAQGSGWNLASIRSRRDREILVPLIAGDMWVGATDQALEGTWHWVDDGSVFWQGSASDAVYSDWNSNEPNGRDSSDCMRVLPGGRWADFQCENTLGYICMGPPD